ncbi:MAG TPA: hypothetical protein VKR06_10180 [Ktedonosporobacter sp.]|nr:hypothetical protein [Ktedonosporobacter sp.]
MREPLIHIEHLSFRFSLIQRRQRSRRAGTATCLLMNGPGGARAGKPPPLQRKHRCRN